MCVQESGGNIDLDNSTELLTFHEAISNLVESEEQLIEEHKSIIQAGQILLEQEQALLEYVDDVDHDIEGTVVYVPCTQQFVSRLHHIFRIFRKSYLSVISWMVGDYKIH